MAPALLATAAVPRRPRAWLPSPAPARNATTRTALRRRTPRPSAYANPQLPTHTGYDFAVVGTGIAGLTHALRVAEHGRVAVITKTHPGDGSTRYAQGGVCAALAPDDSPRKHAEDTIRAGDRLNDPNVVGVVCTEGPALVKDLAEMGARFTRVADYDEASSSLDLHLCREGGHTRARVVHAADATGAEISRALLAQVRNHPRIDMFERHAAVSLVRTPDGRAVVGVDCLAFDDRGEDDDDVVGTPVRFAAACVCLATGGCGQIYPVTTNPACATGDGVALAAAVGAATDGMEFVQFHPTALAAPPPSDADAADADAPATFLVSEAVRGAGATLVDHFGNPVCTGSMADLAPRDEVARDIYAAIVRQTEADPETAPHHVYLDASPIRNFARKFPTIDAELKRRGIDVASGDRIPVAPACHYQCGGMVTDLDGCVLAADAPASAERGSSASSATPRSAVLVRALHRGRPIAGLYAAGECASTGLHGANRLASNSLLEGLVFGKRAASAAAARVHALRTEGYDVGAVAMSAPAPSDLVAPLGPNASADAAVVEREARACTRDLQALMQAQCGIVRTTQGLLNAAEELHELRRRVQDMREAAGPVSGRVVALVELQFLSACAAEVVDAALRRRENVGLHYNGDFA